MEQQKPQPDQQLAHTSLDEVKKQKSNKITIVLLTLAAVLIVVVGILLLKTLQSSLIPSPQPFSVPNEIANWKAYRNTVYKFSVDYPASWTIDHYPSSYPVESADIVLFDKFTDRTLELTKQVTVGIYAGLNESGLPLKEFLLAGGVSIDYPMFIEFATPEDRSNYTTKRVHEMRQTTFRDFDALRDGENRLFVNTGRTVFVFYIDSLQDISEDDRIVFSKVLSSFQLTDKEDTSTWQTYRNEEFGFEVRYPQDFIIKEKAKAVRVIQEFGVPIDVLIEFPDSAYAGTSLAHSALHINVNQQNIECEEFEYSDSPRLAEIINGISFTVTSYSDGAMGLSDSRKRYTTMHGGSCYQIDRVVVTTHYYKELGGEWVNPDDVEKKLDQILSTFRFTP